MIWGDWEHRLCIRDFTLWSPGLSIRCLELRPASWWVFGSDEESKSPFDANFTFFIASLGGWWHWPVRSVRVWWVIEASSAPFWAELEVSMTVKITVAVCPLYLTHLTQLWTLCVMLDEHALKSTNIQGSSCECLCLVQHYKIGWTTGHFHIVFWGPRIMPPRKPASKQAKTSVGSSLHSEPLPVCTARGRPRWPTKKETYWGKSLLLRCDASLTFYSIWNTKHGPSSSHKGKKVGKTEEKGAQGDLSRQSWCLWERALRAT